MSQPLYPSFTPTYHHAQYPSIDPRQLSLDCSALTVVITGPGEGIGRAIAVAFAQAHAKGIFLMGRTRATLEETAALVAKQSENRTKTMVCVADITKQEEVRDAFESISREWEGGVPDVLVNNAGGALGFGSVGEVSIESFWKTYELNVLGPMIVTQTFIRASKASTTSLSSVHQRKTIINLPSGSAHLPFSPSMAAYATSKLANAKLFEYVHHEHADWNVFNLQPGVVATALAKKAGRKAPDDADLAGGMAVWLARSERARELNGKFLWANWDVGEVLERVNEGGEDGVLTLGLKGWGEGVGESEMVRRAKGVHRNAKRDG